MVKRSSSLVFDCVEIPVRRRTRSTRSALASPASTVKAEQSSPRSTPATSLEPLDSVKEEEDEDVKPLFLPAATAEVEDVKPGGRRSTRSVSRISYVEIRDGDDEDLKVLDAKRRALDEDSDFESSEERKKRVRITNAPSVEPKVEGEGIKKEPKQEEDYDTYKAQRLAEAQRMNDKRPGVLADNEVNVLDPSTFDAKPVLNVSNVETEALLALGSFKRTDLNGPEQATGADVNLGMRGPGKAFVDVTDTIDASNTIYTVFVRDRRRDVAEWYPYGKYRQAWCGLAKPGEFRRLDSAKQAELVSALVTYLRENISNFTQWVFENVSIRLDPDSPVETPILDSRFDAPRERQVEAITSCLRENEGIQVYYAVVEWVGPMMDREVRAIVAEREERRAREAPWKVAIEQYEADHKIWKKAAKRAKAKGQAEPPKPERPERPKKPKKPKKAQAQTKRAGRKGLKQTKKTAKKAQRVQEETEDHIEVDEELQEHEEDPLSDEQ